MKLNGDKIIKTDEKQDDDVAMSEEGYETYSEEDVSEEDESN